MPSENEKLRALLAEALKVAQEVRRQAFSVPYAQWSRAQHQADTVCFSIDAALAEPVVDCADCASSFRLVGMRERERDEARAEVARLHALKPVGAYSMDWNHEQERLRLVAEVEMLRGVGCQDTDKAGEAQSGPCGVCRKCAYQRGAEAMREAAASAVLTRFHLSSVTLAQSIRALPIPEDKL